MISFFLMQYVGWEIFKKARSIIHTYCSTFLGLKIPNCIIPVYKAWAENWYSWRFGSDACESLASAEWGCAAWKMWAEEGICLYCRHASVRHSCFNMKIGYHSLQWFQSYVAQYFTCFPYLAYILNAYTKRSYLWSDVPTQSLGILLRNGSVAARWFVNQR